MTDIGKRQTKCKSVAEPKHFQPANQDKIRSRNPYLKASIDLQTYKSLELIDVKMDMNGKFELLVKAAYYNSNVTRSWIELDMINYDDEDGKNKVIKLIDTYLEMSKKLVSREPRVKSFYESRNKLIALLADKVNYMIHIEKRKEKQASKKEKQSPSEEFMKKYGGGLREFPNKKALFQKYFREFCEPKLREISNELNFESCSIIHFMSIMANFRICLINKYQEMVTVSKPE